MPLKTGIPGSKFLKTAPHHILDAQAEEPLFVPKDNILEECLRKDAERVGYNENCINKVVYDSLEDSKGNPLSQEPDNLTSDQAPPSLPTPTSCDND